MMEKALHPQCLVLGMTYDDSTQHNRDAAAMFQYQDVRLFLARLRAAIKAEGGTSGVRFLCAGEQGDRNGRCHWHMIIYSSVDLRRLGEVKRLINGRRTVETDPQAMLTKGRKKVRLNWSLWPHGYVTFQEPDQGGMNYVLSYCLKDQFTEEKSKDTMRQAKSENFATGLFRMSKRPAIGEAWLWEKFRVLEEKGAVLPSLNLKVPGFHGYYHPSGGFREKILWSLVALNKRHVWATGAHAPQWPSLLSSLKDNPHDLEVLNGPAQEQLDNVETDEAQLAKRQRETAGFQARQEFARTCGGTLPCRPCLTALSDDILASLGCERRFNGEQWEFTSLPGFASISERQSAPKYRRNKSNPYCQRRGSAISRQTFPASDQTDLRPARHSIAQSSAASGD